MSEQQKETKVARREAMAEVARKIDERASEAMEAFGQADSFEKALQVAAAMNDLRVMLTPEVMQPIMAMMNTNIGFRTDKDPTRPGKGGEVKPYGVEVVRECFIESKLRGFHPVGNEWNIIAGGFYATKNGFRRKVTKFPGISEFKDGYDVPRNGDKGAIVKCRASWKLNGAMDSIECELPIRVNEFMGVDAIYGKAERKLLKRIHDRLTGMNTPDADAGEDGSIDVKGTRTAAQPTPSFSKVDKADDSHPDLQPTRAPATEPTQPKTPQQHIGDFLDETHVGFDDFRQWLQTTGLVKDAGSISSIDEVPSDVCEMLRKDTKLLLKCARLYGASNPESVAR